MQLPFHTLYAVFCICTIIFFEGCRPSYEAAQPPSKAEANEIISEIMTIGELYRAPEPNNAGTELVFMRSAEGKRALFRLDLTSLQCSPIPCPNEILKLFTWSPDDHYLLLKDLNNNQEWLRIYDSSNKTFQRATKEKINMVDQAVWNDTNKFVYISKSHDKAELRLCTLGNTQRVLHTFSNPGTMDSLIKASENTLTWINERELWSFDLHSSDAHELTKSLSEQYIGLSYCSGNGEYLYCSSDASEWRHLYRLQLKTLRAAPVQLTFDNEHTYNGQWVQQGAGYAYVGNTNNSFYLAVRPMAPAIATNLFVGGHVIAYRVLNQGTKIYAAASTGAEPPSLWEYDIEANTLKPLLSQTNNLSHRSKIIARQMKFVSSFDGLQIPYYFLPPKGLTNGCKFPAVIAIPPEAGQFMQAWEKYSQFIANIGVFHFAVNPRGSDGYGNAYKENSPMKSYLDVFAVYKEAIRNPQVDKDKIFLMTYSDGSADAIKLAEEHPGLWAGVILMSGSKVPPFPFKQQKFPKCMLFLGEQDSPALVKRTKEFKKWAEEHHFPASFIFDKRTTHHITDTKVDKKMGEVLIGFLYDGSFDERTSSTHSK